MGRSGLVNKRITVKNPNWEFVMDGDDSHLSEEAKQEVEDDINKMMDELYTIITMEDLLSKSKWMAQGWQEIERWDLEVDAEEFTMMMKMKYVVS